jgi:hypothetical protein
LTIAVEARSGHRAQHRRPEYERPTADRGGLRLVALGVAQRALCLAWVVDAQVVGRSRLVVVVVAEVVVEGLRRRGDGRRVAEGLTLLLID